MQYIDKILLPYIKRKREELQLECNYPALVIFDNFSGQNTEQVLKHLQDNCVHFIQVPANCMDRLQPLDISVNKAAKDFLRRQFQSWYADKICKQLQTEPAGHGKNPVDLRLSVVKPLSAHWMIKMFDYLKTRPDTILSGFRNVGIFSVLV